MPPKFQFKNEKYDKSFSCNLVANQCNGLTKPVRKSDKPKRCKRMVTLGGPYCYAHAKKILHVTLKPSSIPNAGTGMFACGNGVVFDYGDLIAPYFGELVTKSELNRRYGSQDDIVAPYASAKNERWFEDAACKRGIGAYPNDKDQGRRIPVAQRKSNAQIEFRRINPNQVKEINAQSYTPYKNAILGIFATKQIRDGEEIFAEYGKGYWEDKISKHKTVKASKPKRKCH